MVKKVIGWIILLIIFITLIGCNGARNLKMIPDGLPFLDGVTMRTELEYYGVGTKRLLVYWENNTQYTLMFGEAWQLERYDEWKKEWVTVYDGKTQILFTMIGYELQPKQIRKHTYIVTTYDNNIKKGHYRVKTDFYKEDYSKSLDERRYCLTADFTVTSDKSLLKPSELDFDDLENSREIDIYSPIDTPVHVYRNLKTYDTTIVINNSFY